MFITKLKQVINRILKLVSFPAFTATRVDNIPVVSEQEIHDLFLRAKQLKISRQHNRDIAHRKTGDKRSIYKGYGIDYEESRHYVPGDDPRYMNWNLTARTGQLYMKVFRQERQPGVFILIDKRATMRFGTRKRLKISQAIRIASLTAFNAQLNNKLVGGVIIDDTLTWLKETHNKQEIFDFLNKAASPVKNISEYSIANEYEFNSVTALLNNIITRGSTVYLVSDFHDLDDQSRSALIQLSVKHDVIAIDINDPGETSLPSGQYIRIGFPQKPVLETVITPGIRKEFHSRVKDHATRKQRILNDSGLIHIELDTRQEELGIIEGLVS